MRQTAVKCDEFPGGRFSGFCLVRCADKYTLPTALAPPSKDDVIDVEAYEDELAQEERDLEAIAQLKRQILK